MSVTRATDLWEGAGDIPSFLRRTDGPGAIPFHLLAKIFPLMEGEAFADLVEDISAHGLHEPIVLYEGKILDGRNRYLASKAAEVAPRFETYTGSDPLGFVISKNLHRRHLTESQRAMVAANLATMRQGARTDLSPIGEMSQSQAAELLNVGKRSVERAKIVLSEGSPELIQAVQAGELSVSGAEERIGPASPPALQCAPTPSAGTISMRHRRARCMPCWLRNPYRVAFGSRPAGAAPLCAYCAGRGTAS